MLSKAQSGPGANGSKRGSGNSSTRARGSRGFHPFARPDKAPRGSNTRGASGNVRGGGRGGTQPAATRGSFATTTTRGAGIKPTGQVDANRAARPPSSSQLGRQNFAKSLQDGQTSKPAVFAAPTPNVDRSRQPRRLQGGDEPKTRAPQDYNSRYEQLKQDRAREREHAIQSGLMADPNQPTSLNRAITPTGTCTDMCPEFERVERTVQKMVDKSEKSLDSESGSYLNIETKMIKRFRRSAAGYDEQLPSDIRTPKTLLQTINYILRYVLSDEEELGAVHKFVWDRTRSIRNDLSIQQLTQASDVEIAVKCLERIARFHIISLHLLSSPDNTEQFDHHQEREQLNNTLLSLMYYYDDNCGRITFPNEDEFRAYYIVFSIHDQRPDLEARVQKWPRELRKSPRIQIALELFAAAGNTWEYQGALDAKRPNAIAQGFYSRFFNVVRSDKVSYLMACVAEIYFNQVRQTAIRSIWKAYCRHPLSQQHKNQEWTVEELGRVLSFDHRDQAVAFCEEQGLQLSANAEGEIYLDWADRPVDSVDFQPSSQQTYSDRVVETKRRGRSLAAVILGMNVAQAVRYGMVDESNLSARPGSAKSTLDEGLFVSDDEEQDNRTAPPPAAPPASPPIFGTDAFAVTHGQNGNEQLENMFTAGTQSTQSKSQLSGAAPSFTPESSIGSTATQNAASSATPSQPAPSMKFGAGTGAFTASQSSKLFSTSPATFSSSFTSNAPPSFSSTFTSGFGAPSAFQSTQATPSSKEQPVSNLFTSNAPSIPKPDDSANPFAQMQTPNPASVFTSAKGGEADKAFSPQPIPDGESSEQSKPHSSLFPSSSSTGFGQRNIFGQAQSAPAENGRSASQLAHAHSDDKSASASAPSMPSALFSAAQPSEHQPDRQTLQGAAPKMSTSNLFGTTSSKLPGRDGRDNEQNYETDASEKIKAEEEKQKRDREEREKKQAERVEEERKEAERREQERKEAERREAQRRDEERKEEERRQEERRKEAERREAERAKEEQREAERKAAAEREAARREMERRDREMAQRQAQEVKAAQRDIAKYKTAERKTQDRDTALRRTIEQEVSKRKATDEAEEEHTSSKGTSKALRVSTSGEGLLTVEELLGDYDEFARTQTPTGKEVTDAKKPLINEDEILLSSARLAAHTMSQNRLFGRDTVPDFQASVSSSQSPRPTHSRSRSLSSAAEGDHVLVNGYDVALAPSTPLGLGRSLSRTEQRIRSTGAKGLANRPVSSLLRSSSSKGTSKRQLKSSKKNKDKS